MKKIKIEDLTLSQILEIKNMNLGEVFKMSKEVFKEANLYDQYIGKYVIVRSRNEGINSGYIKRLDETGIILTGARRLYYHKPLDTNLSWYEGVATVGCSSDTKISNPVEEKIIIEDYSITLCTETAMEVIKNAITNKQN